MVKLGEYQLTFDEEDLRAVQVIMDFALKYGGIAAHPAVARVHARMPVPEAEEQAPEKKGKE